MVKTLVIMAMGLWLPHSPLAGYFQPQALPAAYCGWLSRGLAPPLADQVSAALMVWVAVSSLAFLAALGAVSARVGGAPVWNGTWRVAFWGAAAMAVTAGTGALFGVAA